MLRRVGVKYTVVGIESSGIARGVARGIPSKGPKGRVYACLLHFARNPLPKQMKRKQTFKANAEHCKDTIFSIQTNVEVKNIASRSFVHW